MKKYAEILTLVLLALLLNSCMSVSNYAPPLVSGDVLEVSYNSTLAGMKLAVQGTEGTFVMIKDGLTTLIWPMRGCNGVGFVVLDTEQGAFLDQWKYVSAKGNFTAGSSMTAMTDYLVNKAGWKLIPATQLADSIKIAIMSEAGKDTWITLANRIPVFLIVFDDPIVDPFYTLRIVQY